MRGGERLSWLRAGITLGKWALSTGGVRGGLVGMGMEGGGGCQRFPIMVRPLMKHI